jgi:antitoxin YefM
VKRLLGRRRFAHSDRCLQRLQHSRAEASVPSEVTIFIVMTETLPLAHIKAHLSEVVDRVEHQHDRVILTRNGRPAAVLVSPEDLEALEDTLDLLSDSRALTEIDQARLEIAKGKTVDAEALRAKYLSR